MSPSDRALFSLMRTIAARDDVAARDLIDETPAIATWALEKGASREASTSFFFPSIRHHVYKGDTALHVAAASHTLAIVAVLLEHGAVVDARNRRAATPLHYATDGRPGDATWSAAAQVAVIGALVDAGADVNAADADGTTPLLRAVRNRCAEAVRVLVERGADPGRKNKRGSTPWKLAHVSSGKSGSGSDEAQAQQREIVRILGSVA